MALLNTIKGLFGKKKKDEEEIQAIKLPTAIPIKVQKTLSQPIGGGEQIKPQTVNPINLEGVSNLGQSLANVFKNVSAKKVDVAPPPKAPEMSGPSLNQKITQVQQSQPVQKTMRALRQAPLIDTNPLNIGGRGIEIGNQGQVVDLLRAVAQTFPQAMVRVGMTRDKIMNGKRSSFKPTTPIEKLILGEDEIEDIVSMGQSWGKNIEKYTPLSGKSATALGVPLAIGSTAIDLFPVAGTGKKATIKTAEELTSSLQKALKIKNVSLDEGEEAVRVGWNAVQDVLKNFDVDKKLLDKLNAGEVVEGMDFILQKQGDELLANIDSTFKPIVEKVKGVRLGKQPKNVDTVVEKVEVPTVNYVDPSVYANALNSETALGSVGKTRSVKSIKMPDYAKEADAIDRTQVEAVKSSILAGDKINPLVFDEAGNLEDGVHRLIALQELGVKDVQTVTRKSKLGSYTAEATDKTAQTVNTAQDLAREKQIKAEFDEWQKQVFADQGTRTTSGAVRDAGNIIKANSKSPLSDTDNLGDISSMGVSMRDLYRNFQAMYKDNYATAKKIILDPFDTAKNNFTRNQQDWLKQLDTDIVKGLDIKKGSKESALVQLYGEGKLLSDADIERGITAEQKLQELAPEKWQDIIKADEWFRNQYNTLLGQVNEVRQRIYPNDPTKIIPTRQDYYRHFIEIAEGFQGLKNIFEQPSGIASELAGRSQWMKPLSKYLPFAQKRIGNLTEIDAVGGFLNYVKSAEYAKNIDPFVGVFRNLADELAQASKSVDANGIEIDSRAHTNFIQFLRLFADDLSGKSAGPGERFMVDTFGKGGRKFLSVLNWFNARVKLNSVVANVSSSISQIWNIPQSIAEVGFRQASASLVDTLTQMFKEEKTWNKSNFINERYLSNEYDAFETGMLKDARRFALWMTSALDQASTRFIWNMQYRKALDEGLENAEQIADDVTRQLVGGRGVGEVPLLQKDKLFQVVAPFQLEVGNMWWVMKGWANEKEFGKFAKFFVVNYFLNRAMEQIGANPIGFDPIQASIEGVEAVGEADNPTDAVLKGGGRVAGEVLSQTPGANTVIPMFLPEHTTKEFFGRRDPTRFGSGLLLGKGLADPLFRVLPPFGGAQIKKTLEGVSSVARGYEENQQGLATYPIEQSASNYIKGFLFGRHSLPEAQAYYEQEQNPLGINDTITLRALLNQDEDLGFAFYDNLLAKREVQTIITGVRAKEQAFKLVVTDPNATPEQKQQALEELQDEARRASERLQGLQSQEIDMILPDIPNSTDVVTMDTLPSATAIDSTGSTKGKAVKFKVGAIPKTKGITFKTGNKSASESKSVQPRKFTVSPPKRKGITVTKKRPPKATKPRKFKVSGLRVRA